MVTTLTRPSLQDAHKIYIFFLFSLLFIGVCVIGASAPPQSTSWNVCLNVRWYFAFWRNQLASCSIQMQSSESNAMATETSLTFRHNTDFQLNKSKPNHLFVWVNAVETHLDHFIYHQFIYVYVARWCACVCACVWVSECMCVSVRNVVQSIENL